MAINTYWRIWSRTSPRHNWTLVSESQNSSVVRKCITDERRRLSHMPKAEVALDQAEYPSNNQRPDVSLPSGYDDMLGIWETENAP